MLECGLVGLPLNICKLEVVFIAIGVNGRSFVFVEWSAVIGVVDTVCWNLRGVIDGLLKIQIKQLIGCNFTFSPLQKL